MSRALRLAALALLAAPGAAGAYSFIGLGWEEGSAGIAVGRLSTFWAMTARLAADEWSDETAFEFHVYSWDQGACHRPFWDADGPNTLRHGIEFGDKTCGDEPLDLGILAVTELTFDDAGFFEHAGITFNDAWSWAVYDGPWRNDEAEFRRVALHELGHYLGLGHEDSVPSIMATFAGDVDDLTADDIAGANALYDPAPPPALPQRNAAVRCRQDQLRAAGRLCRKQLRCGSRYAKDEATDAGGVERDACVARAEAAFVARWDAAVAATAAAGEACMDESAGASVAPLVSAAALGVESDLGPGDASNPDSRALRAELLREASGLCADDLAAWRRDAAAPDPVRLAADLAEARADFVADASAAITDAASDGVAYDGVALDAVAGSVETLANDLGTATGL
jgi:hypothetical protein